MQEAILKMKNCHSSRARLTFLVISYDRVAWIMLFSRRRQSIPWYSQQTTPPIGRSFACEALCAIFLPSSALIAAPLKQDLKKNWPMHINLLLADGLRTMHKLRDKLVFSPRLAFPYAGCCYKLHTDACNIQINSNVYCYKNSPMEQPNRLDTDVGFWPQTSKPATEYNAKVSR